jgi:aryl-alcohol dehydrogenase-like predicted oxidoreductase
MAEQERNTGGLPLRELGKTGLKVSMIGFGGGHSASAKVDEATTVASHS